MRERWKGPLVLKGVLSVDDAAKARDYGCDGVIISNHGGRQLDQAVSPIEILPRIAEKVQNITLMIDSGFRRGTDVLKALALGARFVFVGRAFPLAGQSGVEHAIGLLAKEVDTDMGLLGLRHVADMGRDRIIGVNSHRFLNPASLTK